MNLATKGFLFLVMAFACKGEPTRSYCEALCDWAVTCAGGERSVDADALTQSCLDTTRASDPSCEKAESGTMDPASKDLLGTCVKDIDAKADAGECNGFTGTIDEIKVGTPPASCTSQGTDYLQTYNDARDTTKETNDELCHRVTDSICQRASDCILGDFQNDIPQAAIDALGGTPYDLCVQRLDAVITDKCISSGLYEPEQSADDLNIARQGARECMRNFDQTACTDLFANPPTLDQVTCGVMFSSPEDLAAVGTALIGLSGDFSQYMR
jgi:hypothetical protein